MKTVYFAFILFSVVLISCNDTEEVVLNEDGTELLDGTTDESEATATGNLAFSVESSNGFQTAESIVFQNQSENLSDFQWKFGDGGVSSEMNPSHSYERAGKFVVELSAQTGEGKRLSAKKEVFIRKNGTKLSLLYISFSDSTLNQADIFSNSRRVLYNVPYNPSGVLALDEANKTVYYYDYTNNAIIQNSLSENNPVILFDNLPGVSDLEFNQSTGDLHIALTYDNLIMTYNVESGEYKQSFRSVVSGRFGAVRVMELKDGKLFTITPVQGFESVFQLDIASGVVSQVINYEDGGYGYGVAYDDRNDKIYFNNTEAAALMRADSDGSNIEKVIDLDRFGTVPFPGLALKGLKVVESRDLLIWSAWEDDALHILDLNNSAEGIFILEGLNGKFVPFEYDGSF